MTILDELTKSEATEFTDSQMGELGKAANRLLHAQAEILAQEEVLKQCKAIERKINQEEIPALMENLGFERIMLDTGQTIAVKDAVQCSIPAAQRPDAYSWMDKNGHGDLIKIAVTSKYGRGDSTAAHNAMASLEAMGHNPVLAESVHAGTLKAWAREELALGHSLPADYFKIHVVKITTVK